MKTSEDIKNSLPNPIKGTKIPGPECNSESKYDINFEQQNKDGCASEFSDGQWKHELNIKKSINWSNHPLELRPDGKSNTVHKLVRSEAKFVSKSESLTKCDNCGSTMSKNKYDSENPENNKSEYISSKPNHFHLGVKHPVSGNYDTIHACSLGCLGSLANKLAKSHKEALEQELAKHQSVADDEMDGSKKKISVTGKVPSVHDDDKSINSGQVSKDSCASIELNTDYFFEFLDKDNNIIEARYVSYKERHDPKTYFIDKKRKSFPVNNCQDVSAVMHRIGTYKGELSTEEIKSRLKRRASQLGCTNSLPKADKTN